MTAVCPVLAGQQLQVGVDQRPRRDQIIQFLLTAHDTTLAPPAAASNNTTAERRHDLIKNLAAWDSYPSAGPSSGLRTIISVQNGDTIHMTDIPHDRPDQLQQIQSGLMQGEQLIAVYDAIGAGTGFLGLTSHRVILQDKSFVGKKVAITSIPYPKITSVSVVSNRSWAGGFFSTGSIAIHVGAQTYEVEFRGEQKSHHAHSVILWHMGVR